MDGTAAGILIRLLDIAGCSFAVWSHVSASCHNALQMERPVASLYSPAGNIDSEFLPDDFLRDLDQPLSGLDDTDLHKYFRPMYLRLPFERDPIDFLIPFDDIVRVTEVFVDSSQECRAGLSGCFKYLGCSKNGFYLHLSDCFGQKFSYPRFFVTDSEPKLFRHSVCFLWRNKHQTCACLVLQNRGIATIKHGGQSGETTAATKANTAEPSVSAGNGSPAKASAPEPSVAVDNGSSVSPVKTGSPEISIAVVKSFKAKLAVTARKIAKSKAARGRNNHELTKGSAKGEAEASAAIDAIPKESSAAKAA